MTLDLALKPVFMRAIRNGSKKVEYRDATEYYLNKLVDVESYGGKSAADILDGLRNGELELHPRKIDYLLFHESGTQRTLMVECLGITYPIGHMVFCIQLGKIKEK